MDMVRLSVPGTLPYRDVVLRAVASVCRLMRSRMKGTQEASQPHDVRDFDDKVVSAVGEAFNNIAMHAYSGDLTGEVLLELGFDRDRLTVRLLDTGVGVDLSQEDGEGLETPRESHMGLVIMRACMDEVTYCRGEPPAPNSLTMTKHYFVPDATTAGTTASRPD